MKNNIIEGKCCGDCAKCQLDVDMVPCAINMIFKNTIELRKELNELKASSTPKENAKPKIISSYECKENNQETDTGAGTDSTADTSSN
ncbi:MAG: hypothetical protein RRY36_08130 [Bacteroidaceae bacterium]